MAVSLQELGLSIKRLQSRHHKEADRALDEVGLTLVQWDALRHLHANPDASLHDLAELTFQSDQAMGSLASRLIARGYIERVASPGRAVRHALTREGDEARVAGADVMNAVLADSFAPLSAAERERLGGLLRKLLAGREGSAPGYARDSAAERP
jgi:DNA-binding MarR family transcriptional regulator